MRIDIDEGSTRDPDELAELERDGAWFIVFANPDATTADITPMIAHAVDTFSTADLMAGALAAKYPDRATYAVGLSRGEQPTQARLITHVPDDPEWSGPPDGEGREAIEVARAHLDIYRRSELRKRDAMVKAESAKVPPVPAAGPDLDDQLYSGKVVPIPGTPAAERAGANLPAGKLKGFGRTEELRQWAAEQDADGEGGGK